jgi:6-phosphogluconolactonase
MDPSGQFLLAGLQEKNQVVVFRRDKATGKLALVGDPVEAPTPVSFIFK